MWASTHVVENSPWAENTQTWPSIMLLCVACVSTALSIGPPNEYPSLIAVILFSYLKSVKWANRLAVLHTTITLTASIVLLICWGISVGLFNMHDKHSATPDLWSWACAHKSATHPTLNWQQICLQQVSFPIFQILIYSRIGVQYAPISVLFSNF